MRFEDKIKFTLGCKVGLVGSDIDRIDDDLNHVFRFSVGFGTEGYTNPDRGPHFLEHGQGNVFHQCPVHKHSLPLLNGAEDTGNAGGGHQSLGKTSRFQNDFLTG